MTTTQTTRHANRAALVAHIADLAAQGYQFDASNVSDNNNCTYQPLVTAYKGAETIYLRYNAMAEGTHYARRIDAFSASEMLIKAGKAEMVRAVTDCDGLAYQQHNIPPKNADQKNEITAPKIKGSGRNSREMLLMLIETHCYRHVQRQHWQIAQEFAEIALREYDAAASPHDRENWPLARKIFGVFCVTMDKVEQGE